MTSGSVGKPRHPPEPVRTTPVRDGPRHCGQSAAETKAVDCIKKKLREKYNEGETFMPTIYTDGRYDQDTAAIPPQLNFSGGYQG
jgi:hypothetical protein